MDPTQPTTPAAARPPERPAAERQPAAPATEARRRGGRLCCIAYAAAIAAAAATLAVVDGSLAWRTFAADVVATLVVFGFSVAYRNSSFYDAYWSVAPIAIALYWATLGLGHANAARGLLALAAVGVWGARLTWNWWRGWQGLAHEDWRYVDLQRSTGALYWPVSLLGIHLMPTVLVFLGCLPLLPALVTHDTPFNVLDAAGVLILATAIWLEAEADNQLLRFRRSGPPQGATLRSGLWARMRHPNYLGEILFWWGLFLLGLGAAPEQWWRGIGALSITLLFRFVSLPMIDRRMQERRPDYAQWMQRTHALLPIRRRR